MATNPWANHTANDNNRGAAAGVPPLPPPAVPATSYRRQFLREDEAAHADASAAAAPPDIPPPSGREGTQMPPPPPGGRQAETPIGCMPALSVAFEQQLAANIRELSLIEGNINPGGTTRVVYVTSCFAGEGKTVAAVSMAYALSVLGNKRVLLVDAHWASPNIAAIFNLACHEGWYDYLCSESPIEAFLQKTRYGSLAVVPVGGVMQGQSVVCNASRLRKRLHPLRDCFDYVVMDGASVTSSSEVAMVSSAVDAVLLVVTCGKTKWDLLSMARDKIAAAGGRVAGVVLNQRQYYIPEGLYNVLSRR